MYRIILLLILISSTMSAFGQASRQEKKNGSKPYILGLIDEVHSKVLGEKRILNIYLPEGYNQKDTVRYPVIYLLDGSADEDFIHVVGLVQFNSFEWVNQVPRSIVVGIATVDRRRDFTFPTSIKEDQKKYPTSGHSDKFISFLETELQPFIEKKYKTNGSQTIIGQSLGGLLITEILLKKPTSFNKYVIISPSLWWDNGSLLDQKPKAQEGGFTQQTDVYIGVGKEGLTPTALPRVMEVDANVLAEKLKGMKSKSLHVHFDYLPQENHATIMHQAVSNSFRLLYPKVREKQSSGR
ncbi:alpha/beta hydrolase [Pontibacter sp. HSC-14F20]|nr:alpha/beta hydrolase [Pontibacter sp. HSC-14F20]